MDLFEFLFPLVHEPLNCEFSCKLAKIFVNLITKTFLGYVYFLVACAHFTLIDLCDPCPLSFKKNSLIHLTENAPVAVY